MLNWALCRYIKESQNRPSKKEREELSLLKKELTDTKELLKLKDTKNGATQARLRNQIKCLEKERDELKTSVDNLQKENSKLNASRRIQRPSEVKMLHEINKNLSKLTEETFKKQLSKSGMLSPISSKDTGRKGSKNEEEIDENEYITTAKVGNMNFGKFSSSVTFLKPNTLYFYLFIESFASHRCFIKMFYQIQMLQKFYS